LVLSLSEDDVPGGGGACDGDSEPRVGRRRRPTKTITDAFDNSDNVDSDIEEILSDIKPNIDSEDNLLQDQSQLQHLASMTDFLSMSRDKIAVIQSFDSVDLTEKDSVIYKLVSSASYDLSKLLASLCPFQVRRWNGK
jgi:hypothetical protein